MNNEALFWQVLKDRTSVRRYKDAAVPQEMLDKLIEAAKLAPVAGGNRNIQIKPFTDRETIQLLADGVKKVTTEKIDVITHPDVKRSTLAYSSNFSWFGKAPALFAVSCRKTPPYMSIVMEKDTDDLFGGKASAAMAVQNILLAATALGLGACCLTGCLFAKEWLEKELEISHLNTLCCLIPLGFPANDKAESNDGDAEE